MSKAGSRKLEINSFAAIDSHAVVSILCESVVLVWVHCLSRGQQETHSLWQQHSFAEMLQGLLTSEDLSLRVVWNSKYHTLYLFLKNFISE